MVEEIFFLFENVIMLSFPNLEMSTNWAELVGYESSFMKEDSLRLFNVNTSLNSRAGVEGYPLATVACTSLSCLKIRISDALDKDT